ncbi:MAG: DMT family transporter [Lachnospiraceae bacterium]|nr:DMT family transporter [Lachnospiraceae bacterium]
MLGFFIAILSGALMSIQGVFNTEVTKNSSLWSANAFVQLTAFLVCMGAWLITDRSSFSNVIKMEPKFMLLGGVIGAFITYTVIVSIDNLGPAKAAMFIVIAQLIVSYVIELLGIWGMEKQPLTFKKVAGMLVAIAGIVLFKWE